MLYEVRPGREPGVAAAMKPTTAEEMQALMAADP